MYGNGNANGSIIAYVSDSVNTNGIPMITVMIMTAVMITITIKEALRVTLKVC